ncbi:MAG: transcription antitermination factor NusB [Alphaproteobacteria bacterium]
MTERLLAVQVLYSMAINPDRLDNNINDNLALIKKIMNEELAMGGDGNNQEIIDLLLFYQKQKDTIIEYIIHHIAGGDAKWQTLEKILQIILSLGVAEMMLKKQSPAIIISSWVEVTKSYFSDQSPKLIHAVLDAVNKNIKTPIE